MSTYQNPIIPGFYPDPSICRVGDDYYLVNSSFEFFPGVPLWHSKDLTNWEQIGYILTRESQLPLGNAWTSAGIYAPTLRYHNGHFYMITTNVGGGGNFFVWAEDIRGPWSDPIWIDHDGIDPNLFWDDDGKVYYTGTWIEGSDPQGIGQFEIDLNTGKKLSDTKIIWYGTGGRCPEGPHMYKKDGWYYLLIAEGGTEYGHMVTVARGKNVWGPFESCPRNPIFSHRDDICSPFQATGHADMVADPAGNWWMVFHAIRPTASLLHHIGRETMLTPMSWSEDGWPVINGGKSVTATMTVDGAGDSVGLQNWQDNFTGPDFDFRWNWLRNPDMSNYQLGNGITLTGSSHTLSEGSRPTMLIARQNHFDLRYQTQIHLSGNGLAGLTVFHTNEHHYDLCVQTQEGGVAVWLRRRVSDMFMESQPVFFENAENLTLRVEADKMMYLFFAGTSEENMVKIGTGSTQLLSTEVMRGTFTGCYAGIFVEGETTAKFDYFSCAYLK